MKLKFNYIILGLIFLFIIANITTLSASGRLIREESTIQPEIPLTITGLKMAFKNMEKEIPYIKFDENLIIKNKKNLKLILRKMKETNRGLETLKEIFSIFENLETVIQWRFSPNIKIAKVVIDSGNSLSYGNFGVENEKLDIYKQGKISKYYDIDLGDFNSKDRAYIFHINLPKVLENYKQNDSKFFKYLSASISHEFGHALVMFQKDIGKEYVRIPSFDFKKYKKKEYIPGVLKGNIIQELDELAAEKIASELATKSACKVRLGNLARRRLRNPKVFKLMPLNIMRVIAGLEIFGMDKLSNSLRAQYKDLIDEKLISDFKRFYNEIVIKGKK